MEQKEKIQQALMKGLNKTQANRLASFIIEFYEDSKATVVSPSIKRGTIVSPQDKQTGEKLEIKVRQFIETTGYNYKIPDAYDFMKGVSLLNRLDGKSHQEIDSMIDWLYGRYQPNGSFDWRMQVRSGAAFRKHYEKIMVYNSPWERLVSSILKYGPIFSGNNNQSAACSF